MVASRTRPHSERLSPLQPEATRNRVAPIMHQRFPRPMNAGSITSAFGGKLVPLSAIGLQREDGMRFSRFGVTVQMDETASMLLNPVRVSVAAYFVPKLALDRFKDMGTIDRSFNEQQEIDASTVPWFEAETDTNKEFYKVMGIHGAGNTDYLESYNQIWNHIAAETSPSLTPRLATDGTLAPAFWVNSNMRNVKPTFDDAMIEGAVAIQPVAGVFAPVVLKDDDGNPNQPIHVRRASNDEWVQMTSNQANVQTGQPTAAPPATELHAEISEQISGIISLADIAQARQTAAWARLRTQFSGKSEEWMVDQLLSGIRLRDEALNQPILLDRAETMIGMTQRFATDGANLQTSVTDGSTQVMLECGIPPVTTGGVFMIVAQALPEQMYERQRDFYFAASTVDDLPNRIADEGDAQPVEMVRNSDVDTSHSLPDDLFGYRPLNGKWIKRHVSVGGKYYRPDPSAAWNENRNRLWTPDVVDVALGPDFYLSTELDHNVFVSNTEEPFEFWVAGTAQLDGLTYFGPGLRESTDEYNKVYNMIDNSRLKGDGTDVPPVPA